MQASEKKDGTPNYTYSNTEINQINIPVLIINGSQSLSITKFLQVQKWESNFVEFKLISIF